MASLGPPTLPSLYSIAKICYDKAADEHLQALVFSHATVGRKMRRAKVSLRGAVRDSAGRGSDEKDRSHH